MNTFFTQLAVSLVADQNKTNINLPSQGADVILQNGLGIAYMLAAIIAVITIIVGGIMYSTSAGDAGNITKAKNLILYAIIGLVLVIAAYAITVFVGGRF